MAVGKHNISLQLSVPLIFPRVNISSHLKAPVAHLQSRLLKAHLSLPSLNSWFDMGEFWWFGFFLNKYIRT